MLEDFLTAARARAPEPSEALMARILADADAIRPRRAIAKRSLRERFGTLFGGWQGIGGLATATAAGLWIGYAGIADPGTLSGGLVEPGAETVELMPGADVFALASAVEG